MGLNPTEGSTIYDKMETKCKCQEVEKCKAKGHRKVEWGFETWLEVGEERNWGRPKD